MDLPAYLEAGGSNENLQMVEGADKMLEEMAGMETTVMLTIAKEKFEGADVLVLKEKCDRLKGGGYYFLAEFEARVVNITMWFCGVTEFVLGEIPPEIYLRKERS